MMTNAAGARYSDVLNRTVELNTCNMSKAIIKAMQVMWVVG